MNLPCYVKCTIFNYSQFKVCPNISGCWCKSAHFTPIMVLSPAAAAQPQLFYSTKLESCSAARSALLVKRAQDCWLFRVGMHNHSGMHKMAASKSPYWVFELPEIVINLVIAGICRSNRGRQGDVRGYAPTCENCCKGCAISLEFVESVCCCC